MLSKEQQALFYRKMGGLIKATRTKAGIKQEVLSKHIGLTRISVVHIEQGTQKVQLHTLIEIAIFLNTSLTDLVPPLESIRQSISPKLVRKIDKEDLDDPGSKEKLTEFVRLSIHKK